MDLLVYILPSEIVFIDTIRHPKIGSFQKTRYHTIFFWPFLGSHSSNFRGNVFTVVSEFQVSTGDFPKTAKQPGCFRVDFWDEPTQTAFFRTWKTAVAVHVH